VVAVEIFSVVEPGQSPPSPNWWRMVLLEAVGTNDGRVGSTEATEPEELLPARERAAG
jgi:hypothetical protein